jgi:hypothetical protein
MRVKTVLNVAPFGIITPARELHAKRRGGELGLSASKKAKQLLEKEQRKAEAAKVKLGKLDELTNQMREANKLSSQRFQEQQRSNDSYLAQTMAMSKNSMDKRRVKFIFDKMVNDIGARHGITDNDIAQGSDSSIE